MDIATLEGKKDAVDKRFSELKEQNTQLSTQVASNNEELLKLAGEYRLLTELIADSNIDQVKAKDKRNA